MDTITLLKLRLRGWLGWELVDVGMQLSAATARPRLTAIAEALNELESRRSPTLVSADDLIDPAAAWEADRHPTLRSHPDSLQPPHDQTRRTPERPAGTSGATDCSVSVMGDGVQTLKRNLSRIN